MYFTSVCVSSAVICIRAVGARSMSVTTSMLVLGFFEIQLPCRQLVVAYAGGGMNSVDKVLDHGHPLAASGQARKGWQPGIVGQKAQQRVGTGMT